MATQASTAAQEPPRPSAPGASSAVPSAPVASSAPTDPAQPQTPRQQGPQGINIAGLNLPGNLNGLSDQARLALAQQAIQANQAAASAGPTATPGGMTMANASALLGGAGGSSNEAIMRQLQALQASQARMSQHRAMAAQAIPSPSNGLNNLPAGASPVNGGPSIPTPPQQTAPSPAGPPTSAPVLNGTGTGPSILQAQLAQQQERLRQSAQPPPASTPNAAQPATPQTPISSANPTAPPSARPGRPGVNPQHQQRQFAQSLANYFKTTSGTLPAEVFNGERDGAVKIAGKWFNLLDFFGHFAKHQVSMPMRMKPDAPHWQALIAAQGLPAMLPEPVSLPASLNTNGTIPPVTNTSHYIVGLYLAYVKGFEEHMQRQQQRQRAMQQAQAAAANGVVRPPPQAGTPTTGAGPEQGVGRQAATPTAPTPTALAFGMQASTPASSAAAPPTLGPGEFVPGATPVAASPAIPSATGPNAPTPEHAAAADGAQSSTSSARPPVNAAANTLAASPMPTAVSKPSKGNKRSGAKASLPPPIDTTRSSATPAGAVATDAVSNMPSSARKRKMIDTQASDRGLPVEKTPPKRARYKVEYNPLHIPMTHMSGWDERAVRSTFPKNNLAHPSHSIHELEIVDMEAVLMGLRSRLPRELSYALAVLSMLSMPHPEDQLDGLPLMHLPEIFHELLDLLEEAMFGEDGYDAWTEKMRGREDHTELNLATLSFEDFEKLGRHWDVSMTDDVTGCTADGKGKQDRTGGTTDIVLATLNLIRNFSMFEDNRPLMGNESRLFVTLSRIIDTRLVRLPGQTHTPEQVLSISEYGTVCRDCIVILTNVGPHVKLPAIPFACAEAVFRLLSRTISSSFDISAFKDSPYGYNPDSKLVPIPHPLSNYRAAEAFYAIAGSDANREAFARIKEDELVEMYSRLIRLLPVTQRALESLLQADAYHLTVEAIALALYSLTFLSPLPVRARMRAVRGSTGILRRLILYTLPRHGTAKMNPHAGLCRRVSEILGVLNGTTTCSGEIGSGSMSFSSAAADGKGWKWASGTVTPGWMAQDSERIQECLMVPQVDPHTFGELDNLWWADEE